MHVKFLLLSGFIFFGCVNGMHHATQQARGKKRTYEVMAKDDHFVISVPNTANNTKERRMVHAAKAQPKTITNQKRPFIYDTYTQSRGKPKMLEVHCTQCDNRVFDYQKDGEGRLLRCYLDRIHSPFHLKERQYELFDIATSAWLQCSHCDANLGKPMIYPSEHRPAYHLINGSSYFKEV